MTAPQFPESLFLLFVLLDLVAIAVCDACFQIVPAVLIWPALLLGITFRTVEGKWLFLVAGAVAFLLTAIPTFVWGEEKAGLGDAQVYALVGLAVGVHVAAVLVIASLCAASWGIARGRKQIPVAPFIACSTAIVMLWGR